MGDHDLGEPGADGRRRPAGAARAVEEVCERWELASRADRRGDRHRRAPLPLRRRARRRDPGRATSRRRRPRYEVEHARGRRPRRRRLRRGRRDARRCSSCSRSPNVRSRAWIYRRYDHLVGSRTVRRPGLDAAVLRLRPSLRGLAVSLDGSGRIAPARPAHRRRARRARGGAQRRLRRRRAARVHRLPQLRQPREAARSRWELAEAIEGMAEACEALGIPVVSGNVSLYNETDGRPIHPTPVVGCVGLVADVRAVPGTWREGDAIFLAGEPGSRSTAPSTRRSTASSAGSPAPLDLAAEARADRVPLRRRAPLLLSRPRRRRRRAGASASRRPRSRAASAPSSTCRTTRSRSSAKAAARPSSRARRRSSTFTGVAPPRIGTLGGARCRASCRRPAEAWRDLDVRRLRHPRPRP